MRIQRFYVPNSLDNFNHLIIDDQDNTAIAVDPFNAQLTQEQASAAGCRIVAIVLTHSHKDHWQGTPELVAALNVPVLAGHQHFGYQGAFEPLSEGDQITLLSQPIHVRETPGHMNDHIVLTLDTDLGHALICADTLFNAGVGNVRAGSVEALYQSITRLNEELAETTLVYPAHDYLCHNLGFTLKFEPNNTHAAELLDEQTAKSATERKVTNLALERQINTFLRLDNAVIRENLQKLGYNVDSNQAVFSALRSERDQW
ncbi:hydroxyacylglutathione hydrolase [Salinibius halmophilus]|uniref:hydroxyacylglutathione hydrolase n=1 Tax=Salinibius halmophilus TaxID=1853216 RepID=UPI000E664E41|nr:hydroxyacylglutathione hydrolase [Salinibius halmophilus]